MLIREGQEQKGPVWVNERRLAVGEKLPRGMRRRLLAGPCLWGASSVAPWPPTGHAGGVRPPWRRAPDWPCLWGASTVAPWPPTGHAGGVRPPWRRGPDWPRCTACLTA
eukprot:233311-Chlamydomonas_euryale.AAC.4